MEEKLIVKTFKFEEKEMEVKIDLDNDNVWMAINEICCLYDKARSTIKEHMDNSINLCNHVYSVCREFRHTGTDNKEYKVKHYSLELILKTGYKIDVDKTLKFKEWVENTLKEMKQESVKSPLPIEVFEDGDFKLEVSVSPRENTVWLTQEEMARLFDVARNTVSEHINNILKDGELDETCVGFSDTPHSNKVIKIYNLDMIISVGFRVKSLRGIIFRKWALKILRQYLIKGYAIDESRVTLYKDNYLELNSTVLRLENKVVNHEDRLTILEDRHKEGKVEKLFFNGEEYDAFSFLSTLINKANSKIILIDNYIDIGTLDILSHKKSNVDVEIITVHNYLTNNAIKKFISQYGNLAIKINTNFHDRFLIIDNTYLYLIGASIKDAGKKAFCISEISNQILNDLLVRI